MTARHTHKHTKTQKHTYTHIHTRIYIHTYIHIHTYTRTHARCKQHTNNDSRTVGVPSMGDAEILIKEIARGGPADLSNQRGLSMFAPYDIILKIDGKVRCYYARVLSTAGCGGLSWVRACLRVLHGLPRP
jgi:hypothetical protein